MNNKTRYITASEVSLFVYDRQLWYKRYIKKEKAVYTKAQQTNLNQGLNFHAKKENTTNIKYAILITCLIMGIFWVLYKVWDTLFM